MGTSRKFNYEEEVRRHAEMVYAVCRRMLVDPGAAEDATQETFLDLLKYGDRYASSIPGFLYRAAVNRSRKHLRSRKRRDRAEKAASEMRSQDLDPPEENPELSASVDAAVSTLPTGLQETVVLCYFKGMPQEEAASLLGVTPSAISQRLKSALEKLRRKLSYAGVAVSIGSLTLFLEKSTVTAGPPTLVSSILALPAANVAPAGVGLTGLIAAHPKIVAAVVALFIAGGTTALVMPGKSKPTPESPLFQERVLATIADGDKASGFVFSADGQRVAYIVKGEGTAHVVVDGKRGPEFESVTSLVFSADGKRFAYIGNRKDRSVVVVDGSESKSYKIVTDPFFSPDGSKVAFTAISQDSGKAFVVVDGQPGEAFDLVFPPRFSPDGSRLVFNSKVQDMAAPGGGTHFRVVDGVKTEIPGRRWHIFSPEGRLVTAAPAEEQSGVRLKIGADLQSESFDTISMPNFTSDGLHFAHWARRNGEDVLVVDQRQLPSRQGRRFVARGFDPTGKNLAFVTTPRRSVDTEGLSAELVDLNGGEPRPLFQDLQLPGFNLASAGAFRIQLSPNGDRHAVALGVMQNDGQRLRKVIIVDGKSIGDFEDAGPPIFSPDGKHVAFRVGVENPRLILNGKVVGDFDVHHDPVFGENGEKMAFGAQVGSELRWKVLDLSLPKAP